jgi:hypothetical protein
VPYAVQHAADCPLGHVGPAPRQEPLEGNRTEVERVEGRNDCLEGTPRLVGLKAVMLPAAD